MLSNVYNARYFRPGSWWLQMRSHFYLRAIRRDVSLDGKPHVLEIGCDCGQLTVRLAEITPFAVGVDVNSDAIRRSGKPYLYVMDAQHLAFDDNMFDIIVSTQTIEHIPDLGKAICEMERVLRPGGIIALIYPWEPIRGCTVVPEALFAYRSLKVCRKFHLHAVTPRKLRHIIGKTSLTERRWRLLWSPLPVFLSILAKAHVRCSGSGV